MTENKNFNVSIFKAYSQKIDNPKLQALKDFSRSSRKFNFLLMQGRLGYVELPIGAKIQEAARFLIYAAEVYEYIDEIPQYINFSEETESDLYKDAIRLLQHCPVIRENLRSNDDFD